MRNYNEVFKDVTVGEPVFLTKNGRGRCVVVDIVEYEKMQATAKLLGELSKGEKSGNKHGWISIDKVESAE